MSEPTYPPVLSKKDFVSRYLRGEFGNCSPSWGDVDEFLRWGRDQFGIGEDASPSEGLFHLRNARVAGGETYYNQTWNQAVARWVEMACPEDWIVSQMIPPEVELRLLIQGEVQQTYPSSGRCGLDLFFTQVRKPMRIALQEAGQHASGLRASALIKHYLCPNSQEWLEVLLERYPEHVIEFSTYSRKWGTLWPGYNTIFWEVRAY